MKLHVTPNYNLISDIFMGSTPQKKKKKAVSLTCGLLTAFMLAGILCPTLVFAANAGSLAASYVSSN
ncbi:MAG: hypothetical protein LIO87_07855, partial [Eubacterium sp.]|nr:hypothetical protein [Eubacterium sp.]